MRWRVGLVVGLGVALRLLSLSAPGHLGDLTALSSWAEGVAAHGLDYYRAGGDANYPAVLWLLWPLGLALHGPGLIVAIRVLSIPFDLAIAGAIFAIIRREADPSGALPAASLYLLNPATIVAGAFWGQLDSLGALPMLLAIVLAARGRLGAAGALGTLAVLVKPQFGVGLLIVGVVAVRAFPRPGGRWAAARAVLGALLVAEAVLLPFGVGPRQYLALIGSSAGQYEFASDQAFNLWGALLGFKAPDAGLPLTMGIFLLAGAVTIVMVRMGRSTASLLAAAALVAMAIYFLPTRVHERYLIGAIALLAPLTAFRPRLAPPFVALSTLFAFTLAYGLFGPHPNRVTLIPLDQLAITLVSLAMMVAAAWCAISSRAARDAADARAFPWSTAHAG